MSESNTIAGAEAFPLKDCRASGIFSGPSQSNALSSNISQESSYSESTRKLCQPYPDFNTADRKSLPWKFEGYRVFSKWIASDESFFIVRHFGALNARVILSLQDEIVELEDRLRVMDEETSRKAAPKTLHNGTFRLDGYQQRKELLTGQITDKLRRYSMSRPRSW
jgi:hypothetical protein